MIWTNYVITEATIFTLWLKLIQVCLVSFKFELTSWLFTLIIIHSYSLDLICILYHFEVISHWQACCWKTWNVVGTFEHTNGHCCQINAEHLIPLRNTHTHSVSLRLTFASRWCCTLSWGGCVGGGWWSAGCLYVCHTEKFHLWAQTASSSAG